jgi:hypothetical protein
MSPVTHFLTEWVFANCAKLDQTVGLAVALVLFFARNAKWKTAGPGSGSLREDGPASPTDLAISTQSP